MEAVWIAPYISLHGCVLFPFLSGKFEMDIRKEDMVMDPKDSSSTPS